MKKPIEESVYTCPYCGNITTDNENKTIEHMENCKMNYDCNKSCFTCKHFALNMKAPFPRNLSKIKSKIITDEIGSYNIPICTKKGRPKDIKENDLLKLKRKCWELFENSVYTQIKDEQYNLYENAIIKAVEEQYEIDEAIDFITKDITDDMERDDILRHMDSKIKELSNLPS